METVRKFKDLKKLPVGTTFRADLTYTEWAIDAPVLINEDLIVEEDSYPNGCGGCVFNDALECMKKQVCTPNTRKDGKSVVFKRVKGEPESGI